MDATELCCFLNDLHRNKKCAIDDSDCLFSLYIVQYRMFLRFLNVLHSSKQETTFSSSVFDSE